MYPSGRGLLGLGWSESRKVKISVAWKFQSPRCQKRSTSARATRPARSSEAFDTRLASASGGSTTPAGGVAGVLLLNMYAPQQGPGNSRSHRSGCGESRNRGTESEVQCCRDQAESEGGARVQSLRTAPG